MINSKLGVHVVIGPRNGYGEYLARLRDAGKPVLIKCTDDFGAAWGAKNEYPGLKSLTVGRVNGVRGPLSGEWIDLQGLDGVADSVSPHTAASWYLDLVLPKWRLNPHIDVWETCNEWSGWWSWQAEFYIEMMQLAQGSGYKLACWACSTGNPPESEWPAIARAAQYAKTHGHYLSMHEYGGAGMVIATLKGTQPYHALRYRALYEYLKTQNADAPLIISECGQNGGNQFIGTQELVDDFAWYDSELAKDPYVVGAACWTLGNWREANIQDALPALAEHMVNASFPDPGTPPPPPDPSPTPCRGAPRVQYPRTYLLFPPTLAGDGTPKYDDAWYAIGGALQMTCGPSADDAGIGDLDRRKVIAVNPGEWPTGLQEFYERYYPGVEVVPINAATPDELLNRIIGGSPEPPPVQPFTLVSPVPSIPLVITHPFDEPRDYDGDGVLDDKHEGVDIRAVDASGNPVLVVACADGVVETDMDRVGGGYGIAVVLRHDWPDGNVYRTWYAHLTENYVSVGQRVRSGDIIGLSGTTGNSTGVHLHLNLQWVGHGLPGYVVPDVVDPVPYLPLSVPPPPPPTLARALVGLHLRSSGLDHNDPAFAGELDLIRRGRIQAVKFTSNSTFESLDALIAAGIPRENIIIRLYMAGNDPNLRDPNIFYFYQRAWIGHAVSRGVLRFEIHNEPNLSAEGLGFAWNGASSFAVWYDQAHSMIHSEFPEALVGFPGLSPQPNTDDWLTQCADVISRSDWVGVHSYWQFDGGGTFGMLNANSGGMYWQRYATRFAGKPIYLTEFSNNAGIAVVSKHGKGLQYARYYDLLREPVVAAFSFVSSAPGGDFPNEVWTNSDIADLVGARGW